KRRSRAEREMSLVELANARGIGLIPQRRLNRQLEQLAEAIADKLDPVVESAAARIPANERNAALAGVATAFELADLSDEALFDANLDESKLLTVIEEQSASARSSLALSEQAEALYRLVLRESVAHLTEVVVTLPSFQQRATKELLSRDNEIIDLLREVLDRMPQRDLLHGSTPDAQFRLDYCREVARRFDQVEIFGITVSG